MVWKLFKIKKKNKEDNTIYINALFELNFNSNINNILVNEIPKNTIKA